jgi:hypothetical protein
MQTFIRLQQMYIKEAERAEGVARYCLRIAEGMSNMRSSRHQILEWFREHDNRSVTAEQLARETNLDFPIIAAHLNDKDAHNWIIKENGKYRLTPPFCRQLEHERTLKLPVL